MDAYEPVITLLRKRLAASGFAVTRRRGNCWMTFPDGGASEIAALDQLPPADAIDAYAARLEHLAAQRQQVLASLQADRSAACTQLQTGAGGNWRVDAAYWASCAQVGWNLTLALRQGCGGTREELARYGVQRMASVPGVLATAGAPAPGDAEMPAALPGQAREAAAGLADTAPPDFIFPDRGAPAPPPEEPALDAWAVQRLARARRVLDGGRSCIRRLLEPAWWSGADDWLGLDELRPALHRYCASQRWPNFAYLLRLNIGDDDWRDAALRDWDTWMQSGAGDADAWGFDAIAPYLQEWRESAQELLCQDDSGEAPGRAVAAGYLDALHQPRQAFAQALRQWRDCGEPACGPAVLDLLELPLRYGAGVLRLIVDDDEQEQLRRIALTAAQRRDDGIGLLDHPLLAAAACFGWDEVPAALLESVTAMVRAGRREPPGLETGALLELSRLMPGAACGNLVRLACAQRRVLHHSRRKDDELTLQLAIAWRRCRPALRRPEAVPP